MIGLLGANAVTREDAVKSVDAGFTGDEITRRGRRAPRTWWTEEYRVLPFSHVFIAAQEIARARACVTSIDADALVIGAGPAGASTAILLRMAGWRVILVEKSAYPRQKVCGECLSAAALALLDRLGVGAAVRDRAGPELQQVGWMSGTRLTSPPFPPCTDGPYRIRPSSRTRPTGRDSGRSGHSTRRHSDSARQGTIGEGRASADLCAKFNRFLKITRGAAARADSIMRRVPIVIDAHGSWERGPEDDARPALRMPRRESDLFGFKASFAGATMPQGLLPVLSFRGGYGGLVMAEDGRLTLAGCIRRDTLASWRDQ